MKISTHGITVSIAGDEDSLVPGKLRKRSQLRRDDAQLMELRSLACMYSNIRLSNLALALLFIGLLTRVYVAKDALACPSLRRATNCAGNNHDPYSCAESSNKS